MIPHYCKTFKYEVILNIYQHCDGEKKCKNHEKSATVITRSQRGWGETKLKLNDPIPKWYYTLRTKLYHSYAHTYISHKGTGCESIYNSYGQVSTLQYFLWYASFPVISHVMYKNVDFNGWGDVGSYQPFDILTYLYIGI